MIELLNVYRDPVVGILTLLCVVACVFFFDSWKRQRTIMRKQHLLDNLNKQFQSTHIQHNLDDFLLHAKNPTQTLITIAQTYAKAGEYEQSIAIYKTLSEKDLPMHEKLEILELLGDSYYRAGFLERSQFIFLEILHYYPHNIQILEYYMRVCENLKHYDNALQAIESLEELIANEPNNAAKLQKIWHTKNYLQTMQICTSSRLTLEEQQDKLLQLYEKDTTLRNVILRHFRLYNVALFWQKILLLDDIMPYIDILWHFQKHEIPLDSIAGHADLLAIYRAKGYQEGYQETPHFHLEVMQLLRIHTTIQADLTCTYTCQSCKAQTPFYTYHCPFCAQIATITPLLTPTPL